MREGAGKMPEETTLSVCQREATATCTRRSCGLKAWGAVAFLHANIRHASIDSRTLSAAMVVKRDVCGVGVGSLRHSWLR